MAARGLDRPILCGIDQSDDAVAAARFAAELAERLGPPLVLLHVALEPWVSVHTPDHHEERREELEFSRAGHLATVLDPIDVGAAASVRRLVEFGEPVEVLRSLAAELRAAYLVVGTRGQGAVEEVFVGSTSGALAREAPCPVVVVPSAPAPSSGATIVCGVDGSDGSVAAARHAGELAQGLGAGLVLAHVRAKGGDEAPEPPVDAARAGAPDVPLTVETLTGAAADELLELARRHDARLVVVGSRGRGAVRATLLGSVSATLVQRADRPVLVVSKRAARAQ